MQSQTVKNLNLEDGCPLMIASDQSVQNVQPGIDEPSLLSGPFELCLGPPRSPRPGTTNVEAGSSRSAQGDQLINSESGTKQTPVISLLQCGRARQLRVYLPMPKYLDQTELRLEPPSPQPPGSFDVQAISSRRSQWTQDVDEDSEEISPRNQRRRLDLVLRLPSPPPRSPSPPPPPPPPPSPPPAVPTYTCPICMEPMVEETSTKCGHLFCDACIRSALAANSKCPLCRRRTNRRGLHRVFFPSSS